MPGLSALRSPPISEQHLSTEYGPNGEPKWSAHTLKLTDIERHIIGQGLPSEIEMLNFYGINNPVSRLKFIMEHADHAVISALQNSERPLKIKKDEYGHYISLQKANVDREYDGRIICRFETPMDMGNAYRDITTNNAFITSLTYHPIDGRLEIEVQVQNYILEEFSFLEYSLRSNPADPTAMMERPTRVFDSRHEYNYIGDAFGTDENRRDATGQAGFGGPQTGQGMDLFATGVSRQEFGSVGGMYQESEVDYFRRRLKNNLRVTIRQRGSIIESVKQNEQTAIDTLRDMISEREYRKYTKYGFILVRGRSGKTYQIFRDRSHTKVWKKGRIVEEVCVRIKDDNIPPTDNLIAFKTMIETDEEEFRNIGNIYNMSRVA